MGKMRNIAFVFWALGWPWLLAAYPPAEPLPDGSMGIFTLIWFFVATLLYEGKEQKGRPAPDTEGGG